MNKALADILEEWLENFILDMRRRGFSARSQRCYRWDLLLFIAWLRGQTNLVEPRHLTASVLEQYQVYLMVRPMLKNKYKQPRTMTAGSRNRHLAELRSFFRYLKRAGKLLSDPSSGLERARETKKLPKAILTVLEMARLIRAIPLSTAVSIRDLAVVEVLYGSGIRRAELLGLELNDLRLSEELIQVLGKGNRERVVPLGKAAVQALELYLKQARPALAQGNHHCLWVSSHGGPMRGREFLEGLREYAVRARIKKSMGFHLFRHTCATHLMQGGADLRSIQTLLGHANLNTTAIYTRVEISDLRKTVRKYHPREKDIPEST